MNSCLKLLILLLGAWSVYGQPGKCDQTPPDAVEREPSDSKNSPYVLKVTNKYGINTKFLPDQTYVLILETTDPSRPFKEFMITVEDAQVDNDRFHFEHRDVEVGTLKTLDDDLKSRYSDRCFSSVENNDISDKTRIEMHWVSPKKSASNQRIRFRAMVAENNEAWYVGDSLTITLEKDNSPAIDSPPVPANETCNLCSEARYELIFMGKWSRGSHSLHFPTKPDDIKYSHMVGATHDFHYTLWEQGAEASEGLKALAEDANITVIERDIISNMAEKSGTRTLIRGKMHKHPHMHEPSHALFRVDRFHHLFSVAIALKPSPDWFLGTSKFELCTNNGWLDQHTIKLYPWDAGTMDGISYDSPRSVTQQVDKVDRVAVGSFNKESPFYQLNLNDLKEFALLEVRRLDVYPLVGVDCAADEQENTAEEISEETGEDEQADAEPVMGESRSQCSGVWSSWSPCVPDDDACGLGTRTRVRFQERQNHYNVHNPDNIHARPSENCRKEQETLQCFLDCY